MDINFIDAQLTCMSVAIYHEAHTQSERAKKAVGEIILNRVKHKSFGKTPCDVVHEKGQFVGVYDDTHKEATREDFLKTKLIAWKVWYKPEHIIGNSEAIDYPNDVKYLPSVVNLNFQKNQNNNFDIIITIGNVIYKGLINNIDKAVIINNDVINFYLSYSASELVFGINKQIFKYKVDNTAFKVKLGSLPFIINKGGNFNLDLYLFVFYKSVITFTEVQQLSRFTYSNLSGLETVINSTPKCDVIPPTTIQTNLDDKFKEMENRIVKLIENKNLKIEEQPKLEIKPLKLQSINENDKVIINNNNNIQHKPFYKWFF